MKYKWKVAPAPTGRYRSFETRAWPDAEYENGEYAGSIVCMDPRHSYRPYEVKTGAHPPLKLRIVDHSTGPCWKAVWSKNTYATVEEAKKAFDRILKANPQFMPSK